MRYDGNSGPNTYHGTSDHDDIFGNGGDDWLYGEGGDDYLEGGLGADHLFGGDNGPYGLGDTAGYRDSFTGVYVDLSIGRGFGGTAEGDTLVDIENIAGSIFSDQLVGSEGINQLAGGDGNDWLVGYGGADTLIGEDGDDNLVGGAGADLIVGDFSGSIFGSGVDTVYYDDSWEGIALDLDSEVFGFGGWYGRGHGGTAEGDTVASIENVVGSVYDDQISGSDFTDNELSGLGGNDWLLGEAGNDKLHGGDGEDHLIGGAGIDTLDGGDGDHDWADYSDSATGVWVELATGIASGGTAEGDILISIESLRGSQSGDQLVGNGINNELQGGSGNDWLIGEDGADILNGGKGSDMLLGGTGADTFVWTSMAELGISMADTDVVLDFDGKFDHIDLSAIDADETLAGDQAFTIATGAFTGPGQIAQFGDYLLLNTDSDTAAEGVIRVAGISSLDPAWFVL
jgi:Ca2+-binding RTX toxin-like protein